MEKINVSGIWCSQDLLEQIEKIASGAGAQDVRVYDFHWKDGFIPVKTPEGEGIGKVSAFPFLPLDADRVISGPDCGPVSKFGTPEEVRDWRAHFAAKVATIETDNPFCGVGCRMKFVGRI